MRLIILLVIIGFTSLTSYSQSGFAKLYNALEIKRSFENALNRSKPAIASFSLPSGGNKFYTINGGISISPTILTTGRIPSKTAFDIFAVYNRNNQIEEEQNNIKAGLSIDHKFLFMKSDQITPRNLMIDITFTNEYLNDKIDKSDNFLSLLYVTPLFAISKNVKFGLPVDNFNTKRLIPSFKWIPGIEYHNIIDAPTDEMKGALARLYMAASANLLVKVQKRVVGANDLTLMNLIETGVDYTYRNDFYNKTGNWEGYLPLFNYTLSLYPFATNDISFGATYLNGSDPISGLAKQEYWQFEFKFKKEFK